MVTRSASAVFISFALMPGLVVSNAAAVPSGTYTGHTKGGLDIKVKVGNKRITKFGSSVYASCYAGNHFITFAFPPAGQKGRSIRIKGDGSFKVVFKAVPRVSLNDDRRTLKGRFGGGRVSGSMRVEGLCSAHTTFRARKQTGGPPRTDPRSPGFPGSGNPVPGHHAAAARAGRPGRGLCVPDRAVRAERPQLPGRPSGPLARHLQLNRRQIK